MAVHSKVTEKIFKNCVQQSSLATMKRVLVLLRQLRNFVVEMVHFDESVADVAFRSMLQVFENVIG